MAAGHTTTFVPTRKPIDGHLDYEQRRPHGMFSTKTKVPKSVDVFNKPVPYTMIGVPWADPAANKDRPERFKGKQIQTRWPHSGEAGAFKKLEYAAGPYDDTSKRDKTKKAGFGTTSSLNRDDLSSTIEVGRYRHHLEAEAKQSRAGTEAIMAEARALSASSRPRDAPTVGIAASLPRFASEFDRSNFVAEFTTKDDPRKKGERVFGTLRPTSAGYGEGAWRKDLLAAPEHAVGNFAASMSSKYARPSSSLSALVPRQV